MSVVTEAQIEAETKTDSKPSKAQLFTGGAATPFAAARLEQLLREDPQFIAAKPLPAVAEAKSRPGLRLAEIVQIVMEGYADRPAIGQRARTLVTDPASGRKSLRLLDRYETVSYAELWGRARAVAADWSHDAQAPVKAGDFVAILGFASPDYAATALAAVHVGAVIVPLQTTAPARQHIDIMVETEPHVLAAGVEYLDTAVEAALGGWAPPRLAVFDYAPEDDGQRERFEAAQRRLAEAGCPVRLETLDQLAARGASGPPAPLHRYAGEDDPLTWLFYTSGTTGTPKGAMITEQTIRNTWLYSAEKPSITLSFMPMSHLVGYGYMFLALANGGTSYCAPKSDLSTLFEDLSLVRPTMASMVPRVCEMFYQHYLGEVDRRVAKGELEADAQAEVKLEIREKLLGGRLLSVGCGSAVLSPEVHAFMLSMLGVHMGIGYSSTEMATATVLVDGRIQRPPVIDYKLADVPELGYFNTDKPYPRGELLIKIGKFMAGYYKRPDLTAEKFDPDGFYRTGDVMALVGPDELVYLDRCNNVQKLSQGEFVAIARLEALFTQSQAIRQVYVYGSSDRAFLLAVVVPSDELKARLADGGETEVRATIRRALNQVAEEHGLNSYEVPRDFLIETEPFSGENGLLTGIGKFSRPNFKARYGERLEQVYAQIAQDQVAELRALRTGGADRPVLETVTRAVQATLGVAAADVAPTSRFGDLGGDSLSALSLSMLLEEIFGVEVPVGVILNPAGDLRLVADYVEAQQSGVKRASFATVHAADSTTVHASDLKLDKFIDPDLLAKAPTLPKAAETVRTVLLTGSTGYLGRFQAMAWLEQLAKTDGKLILIARGADPAQARKRVEAALDTDPALMTHFRALAADHLEVLPGDLGLPGLGLDDETWTRLAQEVDLIVHPAAHVNHVLPYTQLFSANVVGTSELIRLALTTRLKRFDYVSTLGVIALTGTLVDEDGDIRSLVPACEISDGYANGYNISKWAGEVLLREANDLCGLPVSVFRPGMILAHSRYAGQLNVPDMFTRLLFSLAATGVAPATFYAEDLSAGRPSARYEGFAVDFLADAITAIGLHDQDGFHAYNLANPKDDGVSLDSFVDWMIEAGVVIERIPRYSDWLARFETAMATLPDEERQHSMLTLMSPYQRPQAATAKSFLPTQRFTASAEAAGHPLPNLAAPLIHKYVADLKGLGLL